MRHDKHSEALTHSKSIRGWIQSRELCCLEVNQAAGEVCCFIQDQCREREEKEKNMTVTGLYARLGIHTCASMQEENYPGADTGQNQRQHGNSREKFPKQPWCQKGLPAAYEALLTPRVPVKWTCVPVENAIQTATNILFNLHLNQTLMTLP